MDRSANKLFCLKVYTEDAVKFAYNNHRILNLKKQEGHCGFPELHSAKLGEEKREQVEQLLGPSLEQLLMNAKMQ